MTDIVQRIYAAIHLESAEIAPRTSPLIEAAREGAYVIAKLQNALLQIRRITQEDTILDELLEPQDISQQYAHELARQVDELEVENARVRKEHAAALANADRNYALLMAEREKSVAADKEQR